MKNCIFIVLLSLTACNSVFSVCFAGNRAKAPFTVLYSNDTTNIASCESPYHKKGQKIDMSMFRATIDETAGTGVQVHMLQPGFTWVPFWQSGVLPPQEHLKWWNSFSNNKKTSEYTSLVYAGNDFISTFIEQCKKDNLIKFVSIRLNDGHNLENVDNPKRYDRKDKHFCKFYVEHPEYRIGPDISDWNQHVQNWAIPEVREYKFAFIKEICENYDIDGLELDFMRHPSFFRLYETSIEQRKEIMKGFICRVRTVLDQTSKVGQHRWLCVRVPNHLECHDTLGIDLPEWVKAGVDMVDLSSWFYTDQQGDFKEIGQMIPDTPKYVEMTHCACIGHFVGKGYDNYTFRRTTDEQFYTTAHLAYSRGYTGVSAFNFVYYRKHGTEGRGDFCEPPFHIFRHIGDKQWVADQKKQHYYIGKRYNLPLKKYQPLPQTIAPGHRAVFKIDMAPPTGGWSTDARLRVQSQTSWSDRKIVILMNNIQLKEISDVSEPYPTPYTSGIGSPEEYRAFTIPKRLLINGDNILEMKLHSGGKPIDIIYLDVAVQ